MKLQSIKRYETYKDSGVDWISATPSCWPNLRLKDVIAKLESGVSVNASDEPVEGDNIGVLKTSCVGKGTFLPDQNKSVWPTEIERVCVPVRAGRIIISRMNTPQLVGASAYIPKDYPNLFLPDRLWQTVFLTNVKLDSKWLSLLIGCSAFRFLLSTLATGTSPSMKNLGQEKLLSISFPFPPLSEQQAIAAYLDTKTAQIDRNIDLLSQKTTQYGKLKQSLINETVTRGLDKTVPMKDSGVEWIGEVPAHWEVKRVKELGNLVLGKMLDNVKGEHTFYRSYLKSKNIGWLKVEDSNIEKMYFSLAEMKSYRLKKDDILLSEGGEVGKTCFWNDEIEECYIQNSVHKITIYKNNSPRFFLYQSYLLGSIKYYDSIVSHVSIKHLTKEKLSRVNWVRPPLAEQQAIAIYLDEKTAHIDRIVATINSQIDKLKELRLTLINDIVTGKICIFKQEP
ncbi:MAG: restriction endonuclease subunit S [Methylobacter sp.]|nr:restriction endonuclease subunit S [Methylobacter sp.]